jgi:hypothetical protein
MADERQAASLAEERLDLRQIVSEMAEHASPGDHHRSVRIAHGHGLTRVRWNRFERNKS